MAAAGGAADATGVTFQLERPAGVDGASACWTNDAYTVTASDSTARPTPCTSPTEEDGTVMVAPLFIREELRGLMVVATPDEMPRTVVDSLRALSSQVALALESAALTEDLLMQQSEKRFASLVQNSSDVVTVRRRRHRRSATRARRRTACSGYEPESLEGTRFIDLVHPDDKTARAVVPHRDGRGRGPHRADGVPPAAQDGTYIFAETLRTNLLHDDNVQRHRAQHP